MRYLALILATASLTNVASASVYFEDFQGSVGSEWSSSSVVNVQSSANRKGLGAFDNHVVTLTLTGLQVGVSHTLGFDLYVLNSWDGSQSPGPDYFRTKIDNNTVLNATFAVVSGWVQNYSAATPLGSSTPVAGGTDADEFGTLDFNFYGSAVYKFGGSINSAFSFTPTSSTTTFTFEGYGLQGMTDEGWAIDNVNIAAVPEPMTLGALGLGLLGLLRSRRTR